MSEGETHLSSRRAAASHSAQPRRAEAHAGAYAEERQASHHTAGGERSCAQWAPRQPASMHQARKLYSPPAVSCKACCAARAFDNPVLQIRLAFRAAVLLLATTE